MRLSNSFLASARLISNNCSSPSMVYEAMKRTMDKTLIMLQNRYVVDLFTKLRAKTQEIILKQKIFVLDFYFINW